MKTSSSCCETRAVNRARDKAPRNRRAEISICVVRQFAARASLAASVKPCSLKKVKRKGASRESASINERRPREAIAGSAQLGDAEHEEL